MGEPTNRDKTTHKKPPCKHGTLKRLHCFNDRPQYLTNAVPILRHWVNGPCLLGGYSTVFLGSGVTAKISTDVININKIKPLTSHFFDPYYNL